MKTVTEFFKYSVNNILYQREIYPSETFKREKAYGLALFVTTEPGLSNKPTQHDRDVQTSLSATC